MSAKVLDLKAARHRKRRATGWTKEEILKRAREEHARMAQLDLPEPDVLISGNPETMHEEHDDDDDQA